MPQVRLHTGCRGQFGSGPLFCVLPSVFIWSSMSFTHLWAPQLNVPPSLVLSFLLCLVKYTSSFTLLVCIRGLVCPLQSLTSFTDADSMLYHFKQQFLEAIIFLKPPPTQRKSSLWASWSKHWFIKCLEPHTRSKDYLNINSHFSNIPMH